MNRRINFVLLVLAILAATATLWYLRAAAKPAAQVAPTAATAASATAQPSDGEGVISLTPEQQRHGGIVTVALAPAPHPVESTAYAVVADPQPLLELAQRLAATQAEREALQALQDSSQAQFERTQTLQRDDGNASLKSVQEARAAWQADRAKLRTLELAQDGLRASLRQQFGTAIEKAASSGSDLLPHLAQGQASIVRLTLPSAQPSGQPEAMPERIELSAQDGRTVAARKLSAAPQVDPVIQGRSYFYLSEQALPVNERLAVYPAPQDKPAPTLAIPDDAVVWYGGQRWAYVRTAADRFERRLIEPAGFSSSGIIVTTVFHAGDALAVRGAQLLLSEELRPKDIATVCKDPPECDD